MIRHSQRGPHGGACRVGGSVVVRPFAAGAQQADQVRRIGVLMQLGEGDPQSRVEVAAFLEGLQELGWSEGRNPRIDTGVCFLKHQ
jgi:hypothetical protein